MQFVPFNKFKNNPSKLAEETLKEIPNQFLQYVKSKNIVPLNIINNASYIEPPATYIQPNDYSY